MAISERTREDAVYTRFDSAAEISSYLPADVELIGFRGIRVLLPLPHAMKLPLLSQAIARVERWAADNRHLRNFGGFLVAIVRKKV